MGETFDALNLRAYRPRSRVGWARKRKREEGKKKQREGERSICMYILRREDGYRVPNRDPRDRVIRIEMNVNPLNTIPGQNTATRGSESGQIRYRWSAAIPQDVAAWSYLTVAFSPSPPSLPRRREPRDLPTYLYPIDGS